MKSKVVALFMALGLLGGCGFIQPVDVCSAIDMVKAGHVGASALSGYVCQKLEGEAKERCLKEQKLAVETMNLLLGGATNMYGGKCKEL